MRRLVLSLSLFPILLVGLVFWSARLPGQSYSSPSIPGANPTLSNLGSPTAINQNLLFSPDNTFTIGASGATRPSNIFAGGTLNGATFATATTCTSAGGSCGSAAAGQVTIAAAATTVTVATTAVHANSQIFLGVNSTLGTTLGVTCNTTAAFGQLLVTTVTANTSFVVTISTAPTTNPECIQYWIVN